MSKSLFLTLPDLARRRVYEYALTLHLIEGSKQYAYAQVSTSLFYVNRQVSAEAKAVFCSSNLFTLIKTNDPELMDQIAAAGVPVFTRDASKLASSSGACTGAALILDMYMFHNYLPATTSPVGLIPASGLKELSKALWLSSLSIWVMQASLTVSMGHGSSGSSSAAFSMLSGCQIQQAKVQAILVDAFCSGIFRPLFFGVLVIDEDECARKLESGVVEEESAKVAVLGAMEAVEATEVEEDAEPEANVRVDVGSEAKGEARVEVEVEVEVKVASHISKPTADLLRTRCVGTYEPEHVFRKIDNIRMAAVAQLEARRPEEAVTRYEMAIFSARVAWACHRERFAHVGQLPHLWLLTALLYYDCVQVLTDIANAAAAATTTTAVTITATTTSATTPSSATTTAAAPTAAATANTATQDDEKGSSSNGSGVSCSRDSSPIAQFLAARRLGEAGILFLRKREHWLAAASMTAQPGGEKARESVRKSKAKLSVRTGMACKAIGDRDSAVDYLRDAIRYEPETEENLVKAIDQVLESTGILDEGRYCTAPVRW